MQIPPFPRHEPEMARLEPSGIMTWGSSREREANLAALQHIQPTKQEQRIYEWWDHLDARVWRLAEKAARDGQAPREVQQVRRLSKAMSASTAQMVSKEGRRIVRQHTQEKLTEQ